MQRNDLLRRAHIVQEVVVKSQEFKALVRQKMEVENLKHHAFSCLHLGTQQIRHPGNVFSSNPCIKVDGVGKST